MTAAPVIGPPISTATTRVKPMAGRGGHGWGLPVIARHGDDD